ncbi:MAG: hypothetical protein AB7H93_24620 [Vicinamibacterales bacterium]
MLRHALRAALLAGAGALIVALVATDREQRPSATSRIAVSDAVNWPFYGSARETLLGWARDPALQQQVRSAVAAASDGTTEAGQVELRARPTSGEITVELSARAADGGTAVDAADRYAQAVLDRSRQDRRAEQEDRLGEATAALAALDERIAAEEQELAAIAAALAAGPSPVDDALLTTRRDRLLAAQRQAGATRGQLQQELDAAQRAVDGVRSTAELVRPAVLDGGPLRDATTLAVAAAAVLGLIGLAASVLWDQTFGVVRRPSDLRWVSDAPVTRLGRHRGGASLADLPGSAIGRRLARRDVPGCGWLLVPVGGVDATPLAVHLSRALARRPAVAAAAEPTVAAGRVPGSSTRLATTPEPATDAERSPGTRSAATAPDGVAHPRIVIAGPEGAPPAVTSPNDAQAAPSEPPPADGEADPTIVSMCAAVLVLASGRSRLPAVRRAIRACELEGLPLEAVVLLDDAR